MDIIKSHLPADKCHQAVKQASASDINDPKSYYEHPIFGRLCKEERHTEFSDHSAAYGIFSLPAAAEGNLYECRYVCVNSASGAYECAMLSLARATVVGVSFYHSDEPAAYTYLSVSWPPNWNLIIDVKGMTADDFQERFAALAALLSREGPLKVVHGGARLFQAVQGALRVELAPVVELQVSLPMPASSRHRVITHNPPHACIILPMTSSESIKSLITACTGSSLITGCHPSSSNIPGHPPCLNPP